MAAEYDIVDLWVGTFASKRALNAYLKETHDEDNEDAPISPFARDLGQSFYDHDFMEVGFRTSTKTLEKLCEGHSFVENFLPQAAAAYQKAGLSQANTLIMVFGKEIDHPQTIRGEGFELHYLGQYDTRPPAGAGSTSKPLFLEIRGGSHAVVNGEKLTLVKITAPGAVVGHGGSSDDLPYIDLPEVNEEIAPIQLRISLNESGEWVLEDVAGGDKTAYIGRAFNREKVIPGHDQRFGVAGVTLAWLLRPPRGKR